ncbi:MAG: DNA polymerase III subunit beta [Pseudomonadota bacterium]|nr:DNA polymerase III subunit beta [Pseudomonadota bacterium]
MKLTLQREELLKPLQLAIGVVERRQTLPILANVLLRAHESQLTVTGTDLEVELVGRITLQTPPEIAGEITVPGRKLLEICKSLPEGSPIKLELDKDRLMVTSGRSRFELKTLPANEFPSVQPDQNAIDFSITQSDLSYLLHRTHFAMAQQDVRFYLNGLLLEVKGGTISTVATDGHRLALNTINFDNKETAIQALLPFKGVHELIRLINNEKDVIGVSISANHLRAESANFIFTSKLIDGSFPSYDRVVPKNCDKSVNVDRHTLKKMLQRASILTNEKFRGVRMLLNDGMLTIEATNPEQEAAREETLVEYALASCELGFNVDYIIDVLDTVDNDTVTLSFIDNQTGVLIEESRDSAYSAFVIMPLRL